MFLQHKTPSRSYSFLKHDLPDFPPGHRGHGPGVLQSILMPAGEMLFRSEILSRVHCSPPLHCITWFFWHMKHSILPNWCVVHVFAIISPQSHMVSVIVSACEGHLESNGLSHSKKNLAIAINTSPWWKWSVLISRTFWPRCHLSVCRWISSFSHLMTYDHDHSTEGSWFFLKVTRPIWRWEMPYGDKYWEIKVIYVFNWCEILPQTQTFQWKLIQHPSRNILWWSLDSCASQTWTW